MKTRKQDFRSTVVLLDEPEEESQNVTVILHHPSHAVVPPEIRGLVGVEALESLSEGSEVDYKVIRLPGNSIK